MYETPTQQKNKRWYLAVVQPIVTDGFLRPRDPGRSQQGFNLLITILTGSFSNQELLFGAPVTLLADKSTLELSVYGVCL